MNFNLNGIFFTQIRHFLNSRRGFRDFLILLTKTLKTSVSLKNKGLERIDKS